MVVVQRKKLIIFALFILIFVTLFRTTFILWNSYLPDFSVFYDSALLLSQHQNPYDSRILFTQNNYPPPVLILMLPLLLFKFAFAEKIWLILSILFVLISIYILYRVKPIPLVFLLSFIFLAVSSFPFKFTLGMGQVNVLILLLISLFLFLTQRKKEMLALIMLALSIVIKLFPVLLLVNFLTKFMWRKLFIVCLLSILLFFAPILFLGTGIYSYYFDNILFPLFLHSTGGVYYNQSITGFFARLNFPNSITTIIRVLILLTTVYFLFRNKIKLNQGVSVILLCILLINNFTWQHHLILLILPYYFILSTCRKKCLFFLVFISYFLVAINIKNPSLYDKSWYGSVILSHGFLGVLILWITLIVNINSLADRKKCSSTNYYG